MAKNSEAHDYSSDYSEAGFWEKLKGAAKKAGSEVVEKSLLLHYAAQRPETPAWAKATVYAALGYFIVPLDAIADLTPAVGYADDLGVLAMAIATIAIYINDDVRTQAKSTLSKWMGEKTTPGKK